MMKRLGIVLVSAAAIAFDYAPRDAAVMATGGRVAWDGRPISRRNNSEHHLRSALAECILLGADRTRCHAEHDQSSAAVT